MKKKTVTKKKASPAKKKATAKKTISAKKKVAKKATPAKKKKKVAAKKKVVKKVTAKKKTTATKKAVKKAAPKKKAVAKKRVVKKAAPTKKKTTAKKVAKKATPAKKRVTKKAAPAKRKTTAKKVAKKTTPAKKRVVRKNAVAKKPTVVNVVKTLKNEAWKKVAMPHPTKKCDYYISNKGRLKSKNKSTKSEYLLKGSPMRTGYLQLNVKLQGEHRANYYVHKLVAQSFIPNRSKSKNIVIHVNGDKKNNSAKNLRWVDKAGLSAHHRKLGTYKYVPGSRALPSHVVMTEAKVRQLKRSLRAGKITRTKLSEKFNITMTQIKRIERGENWGHVTID